MFEIDPYTDKVKPAIFPPRMDTRANKVMDVQDGSKYYGTKAGQSFDQVAKSVNAKVASGLRASSSRLSQEEASRLNAKVDRHIMGQRQISKIYEGMSLLPQDVLANADQLNSTFNFERVKEADYLYLPNVLQPQYITVDETDTIEDQVYSQRFYELLEENPGEQSTSPHNLNLMHGIGSNPFKDGDSHNYERFQKSPYFSALHDQSMTPRNILQKLDPTFWTMVNDGVESISNTNISKLTPDQLSKFKNPYGSNHFGLNWEGVADPYTDSNTKTFDITGNFHTIVTSQLWQFWDEDKIFSFINRLWESSTRVDDVLREIVGKASNAPLIAANDAEAKDPEFVAENARRAKAFNDNVDQWWRNVGYSLNEAEVLPFGLLASFAPLMQTMKSWGNWADKIEDNIQLKKSGDSFGFKEKMITGYLDYASNTYIFDKFQGANLITPSLIGAENPKLGQSIFSDLTEKGYLDGQGKITDKFDASDPNFNLQINFSEGEKRRVRDVLRQASVGAFSLDIQDKTLVGGIKRADIRVPAADGTMRTLPELIDLLKRGTTPYDRVRNSQIVYNTLFDMHSTMTGLMNGNNSNGKAVIKAAGGKPALQVTTDGSWKEWDVQKGWRERSGAVTLKFDKAEDANAFKDQIRILIALLEPVVGTFGPEVQDEGGIAFRMLVDNSGSTDSVDMITDKSSNYKLSVDTLYDSRLFETQEWQSVSNRLQKKVIFSVANAMFGRNAVNAMQREQHRNKKEDYTVAKQDYEYSEAQRIVKELETRAELRREERDREQKLKEERKKEEAESNKRIQEDRARRAQAEKQTSSKKG